MQRFVVTLKRQEREQRPRRLDSARLPCGQLLVDEIIDTLHQVCTHCHRLLNTVRSPCGYPSEICAASACLQAAQMISVLRPDVIHSRSAVSSFLFEVSDFQSCRLGLYRDRSAILGRGKNMADHE